MNDADEADLFKVCPESVFEPNDPFDLKQNGHASRNQSHH